jgi:hypothetical protein
MPAKTTSNTTRTGVNISASLPSTEMGAVIPYLAGKQLVNGNLVWAGNPKALRKTQTDTTVEKTTTENDDGSTTETVTTKTVKTNAVVGLVCDLQLLLCLGPNVSLRRIICENETVWEGNIGPARSQIVMPESDSGLSGATIWFSGGAFNQAPDPDITGVADLPGYVGFAYVLVKNFRADKTTGSLAFEVQRLPSFAPQGAGADSDANGDVNAAVLIGDVITNDWGGVGVDLSDLDVGVGSTFAGVKQALIPEGNFGTVIIRQETAAVAVLKDLQDQIDGVIYQSPDTQKITLSLFRDNFSTNPVDQIALGERDIIAVSDWSKSGWNDTVDALRVTYPNRANLYKDETLIAPNGLTRGVAGRGRQSETASLPYVPETEKAYGITYRMMRGYGLPTFECKLYTTRKAAYARPGQLVTFSYSPMKLFGVRANVVSCDRDPIDENRVALTLKQADFLKNAAVPVDPVSIPTAPPLSIGSKPLAPENIRVLDTPFYFVRARGIPADPMLYTTRAAYPMFLASAGNASQQSYSVVMTAYPGRTDFEQVVVDKALYPSFGRLSATLAQFEALDTGIIPALRITRLPIANDEFVTEALEANSGERFLLIDNEFMAYESATIDGGEYVLANVHRGLIDTAPQGHADNAAVYIFSNNYRHVTSKPIPMLDSFVPPWRFSGYSARGAKAPAEVTAAGGYDQETYRNSYPPRPHDARVDGLRTGLGYAVGASIDVTWKTRYRKAEGVTLVADAAERGDYIHTPTPVYQIHEVVFVDRMGIEYVAAEAVTPQFTPQNALTVTVPTMFNGPAHLYVRASFNGNLSLFNDVIPIGDITGGIETGYGNGYGYDYGGTA